MLVEGIRAARGSACVRVEAGKKPSLLFRFAQLSFLPHPRKSYDFFQLRLQACR
jgi:hypothetical protein